MPGSRRKRGQGSKWSAAVAAERGRGGVEESKAIIKHATHNTARAFVYSTGQLEHWHRAMHAYDWGGEGEVACA